MSTVDNKYFYDLVKATYYLISNAPSNPDIYAKLEDMERETRAPEVTAYWADQLDKLLQDVGRSRPLYLEEYQDWSKKLTVNRLKVDQYRFMWQSHQSFAKICLDYILQYLYSRKAQTCGMMVDVFIAEHDLDPQLTKKIYRAFHKQLKLLFDRNLVGYQKIDNIPNRSTREVGVWVTLDASESDFQAVYQTYYNWAMGFCIQAPSKEEQFLQRDLKKEKEKQEKLQEKDEIQVEAKYQQLYLPQSTHDVCIPCITTANPATHYYDQKEPAQRYDLIWAPGHKHYLSLEEFKSGKKPDQEPRSPHDFDIKPIIVKKPDISPETPHTRSNPEIEQNTLQFLTQRD